MSRKFIVGGDHGAVELELDHRLDAIDRRHLSLVLGIAKLGGCHVRRKLHDTGGLAILAEHGVVGGAQPDLAPAFREPLELGCIGLAASEALPELRVFWRGGVGGDAEHAVMLSDDFAPLVTKGAKEILVRVQHLPVEIEFDDRLHAIEGRGRSHRARHGTSSSFGSSWLPFLRLSPCVFEALRTSSGKSAREGTRVEWPTQHRDRADQARMATRRPISDLVYSLPSRCPSTPKRPGSRCRRAAKSSWPRSRWISPPTSLRSSGRTCSHESTSRIREA